MLPCHLRLGLFLMRGCWLLHLFILGLRDLFSLPLFLLLFILLGWILGLWLWALRLRLRMLLLLWLAGLLLLIMVMFMLLLLLFFVFTLLFHQSVSFSLKLGQFLLDLLFSLGLLRLLFLLLLFLLRRLLFLRQWRTKSMLSGTLRILVVLRWLRFALWDSQRGRRLIVGVF